MVFLSRFEEGAAAQAEQSARFLNRECWSTELDVYPFELGEHSTKAYFFDSGIIGRGFLALWRANGDPALLNAAAEAADSMIAHFTATDGYHPILALPDRTVVPYREWWSQRPGCFQLKAALLWRELFEITGEARYEVHFRRALEFAMRKWPELLATETETLRVMDRLHAYCYFLEGLLPEATAQADALRQGITEITRHLHQLEPQFVRSDVYAQLLRLRMLAESRGIVPMDQRLAEAELEALEAMQLDTKEEWARGAFAFGRRNGEIIPHANPVSTGFAVQAMTWWRDWVEGKFSATWQELI